MYNIIKKNIYIYVSVHLVRSKSNLYELGTALKYFFSCFSTHVIKRDITNFAIRRKYIDICTFYLIFNEIYF